MKRALPKGRASQLSILKRFECMFKPLHRFPISYSSIENLCLLLNGESRILRVPPIALFEQQYRTLLCVRFRNGPRPLNSTGRHGEFRLS